MTYGLLKFSDFLEPSERDQHASARDQVASARDQHASTCDQVVSAPAHMSFETQKTSGAISHSKLVQIGHWRCFLAFAKNVDAKKHLKRPIWTMIE